MKKKYFLWLLLPLLGLALLLVYQLGQSRPLNKEDYVQSTRPTLFFHGYGSSSQAENHMANAAKEAGVTQTIIEANVDKEGQVSLRGEIPKGAVNPIVKVNYEDNSNPDYRKNGSYAYNVVRKLQETYGFQEMNMVGHSMGNMSIVFYLLENATDTSLPRLIKQVNIAGHFDGIVNFDMPENLEVDPETGQPNQMSEAYASLLGLREVYPESQIDVLNIYGDKGNGTDGPVNNASSKTLKYLVADRAKSYKEALFTGEGGRHRNLRQNPEVDKLLIDFLWGK